MTSDTKPHWTDYDAAGCVRLLAAVMRRWSATAAALNVDGRRTHVRRDAGCRHKRKNSA